MNGRRVNGRVIPSAARARGEAAWISVLRARHPALVWQIRDADEATRRRARATKR